MKKTPKERKRPHIENGDGLQYLRKITELRLILRYDAMKIYILTIKTTS